MESVGNLSVYSLYHYFRESRKNERGGDDYRGRAAREWGTAAAQQSLGRLQSCPRSESRVVVVRGMLAVVLELSLVASTSVEDPYHFDPEPDPGKKGFHTR